MYVQFYELDLLTPHIRAYCYSVGDDDVGDIQGPKKLCFELCERETLKYLHHRKREGNGRGKQTFFMLTRKSIFFNFLMYFLIFCCIISTYECFLSSTINGYF